MEQNSYINSDKKTIWYGKQILLDLWNPKLFGSPEALELLMIKAAEKAGATVIKANFHRFGVNGGVSGVVILAESHISIHTWPESNFVAIDMFMCGKCDPIDSIPVILEFFTPEYYNIQEMRRGIRLNLANV